MKFHGSSLTLGVLALALTASMSAAQSGTTTPAPARAATPVAKTTTSVTKSVQAPSGMTPASTTTKVSTKSHMAARSRVNLNTASREDLAKLPGISEDTADKIIAGRPYKSKADLVKNKVLTAAQYSKVRMMITAKPEAAK